MNIVITSAEITSLWGSFWWPFVRIGAVLLSMPFFGDALISVRIRIGLTLCLAFLVYPFVPTMPVIEPLSLQALYLTLEQILWGFFFGLILHLLFTTLTMLGQMISLQMGLAMAVMNDPVNGMSVPIISRLFLIFCTLLFLSMDAHLLVIQILVNSFQIWPIGSGITDNSLTLILKIFGWTISAALGLALPTIICMLLTNVAFGIMNRVSPSFNIFALGFPMTMLVGLFSMLLSASNIPSKYNDFVVQTLDWLTYYNQGAP